MRRSTGFRQRGDTLVEVLICVMIVSVVLMGAYVATQQSSRGIRNSQEHAEALKLVQSQLELVRNNAEKPPAQVFTAAQPFCVTADGAIVAGTNASACLQDASGAPTTSQPQYRMAVTRQPDPTVANAFVFTVQASWDDINGSNAQETLRYRLYQP